MASKKSNSKDVGCRSFGKSQKDKLIEGPSMCATVRGARNEIITEGEREDYQATRAWFPSPKTSKLSISTSWARNELRKSSLPVHNHYKRIDANQLRHVELKKSNILLVGLTGTGKTFSPRPLPAS